MGQTLFLSLSDYVADRPSPASLLSHHYHLHSPGLIILGSGTQALLATPHYQSNPALGLTSEQQHKAHSKKIWILCKEMGHVK